MLGSHLDSKSDVGTVQLMTLGPAGSTNEKHTHGYLPKCKPGHSAKNKTTATPKHSPSASRFFAKSGSSANTPGIPHGAPESIVATAASDRTHSTKHSLRKPSLPENKLASSKRRRTLFAESDAPVTWCQYCRGRLNPPEVIKFEV